MKIIYRGFTYNSINATPVSAPVSVQPSVVNWCAQISSQDTPIINEPPLYSQEYPTVSWRYQLLLAS